MLLDHRTDFPQSSSIQRVMNAWSNSPYKVIIVDFEYDSKLLPVMKHEAIFQIAIANACGDWTVPPVSINHGILISELAEKASSFLSFLGGPRKVSGLRCAAHRQISKFYGPIGDNETPGRSWAEIADMIENYTKVS